MEAGADLVEADLRWQGGRLVARHARRLPLLPVLWDKWYLRLDRGHTLALEELLECVRGRAGLLIDVKGLDRRLAPALVEILKRRDAVPRVHVSSVYWGVLERIRRQEPNLRLYRTVNTSKRLDAIQSLPHPDPLNAGIAIHRDLLNRNLAESLTAGGNAVLVWPVNEMEAASELLEWGVTGLISDSTKLLRNLKRDASSEG